jgi:hypothetical protein
MGNLITILWNENEGFCNYLSPKKVKEKETVNSFTIVT